MISLDNGSIWSRLVLVFTTHVWRVREYAIRHCFESRGFTGAIFTLTSRQDSYARRVGTWCIGRNAFFSPTRLIFALRASSSHTNHCIYSHLTTFICFLITCIHNVIFDSVRRVIVTKGLPEIFSICGLVCLWLKPMVQRDGLLVKIPFKRTIYT